MTQLTFTIDGIWFSEDTDFSSYRLELRGVKIGSKDEYEDVRFSVGRPGNWTGLCQVAHEMERIRLCAFGEIDPVVDEMSAAEMAEEKAPKTHSYGAYNKKGGRR